jgi:hypothetical protein
MTTSHRPHLLRSFALSILLAVLACGIAAITACKKSESNPLVATPTYHLVARSDSMPHGHTWHQWAGLWWDWDLSLPPKHHPLSDTAPIDSNQTGSVWFLGAINTPAGAQKETLVTRQGTIPVGTALFFPILNTPYCVG